MRLERHHLGAFPGPRPTAVTRALLITQFVSLAILMTIHPCSAQVTAGGNLHWTEDQFDLTSYGPDNLFGGALATCDFNHDGYQDLAISAPGAAFLGTLELAGVVHVAYGGPGGLTLSGRQTLTQDPGGANPPEAGDSFGAALAAGDFDHDGHCDLAVGSPNEGLGALNDAGSVQVFAGSDGGLVTPPQEWSQDTPGVQEVAEAYDGFGSSLCTGDFNGDGFDDLAIGVPGENEGGGDVHVLFGSSAGLTVTGADLLYQGGAGGAQGAQEPGDLFGLVLAAGHLNDDAFDDLVIASPREDLVGHEDEGRVQVFYGASDGLASRQQLTIDQATIGLVGETDDAFGGAVATGDFNGDGRDDLAIGSNRGVGPPGSEIPGAGTVSILFGTTGGVAVAGAQLWSQDTEGIGDQAENGDAFGHALATGDFDGDGRDDLAVGVPSEDFESSGHADNGALHVIYGSPVGLIPDHSQVHGQSGWAVGGVEDGDAFGRILAAGDFDHDGVADLVVGVPDEDVGSDSDAGLVALLTAQIRGLIFRDGFETGDLTAWSGTSQ